MSQPLQPAQYTDPKSRIVEGFDGNIILAEGASVPTDTTPGYAPGCHFIKRAGAVGAQVYVNQGTALSCTFVAMPDLSGISSVANALASTTAAKKVVAGVATITGTGDVVTGLTTVSAVVVTMQADASLTNGTSITATIGNQAGVPAAGSVTINVWKPTSSIDGTPIASAAAVDCNWFAFGA
jgi:hypothetical protein